jgi:cytochrome c5
LLKQSDASSVCLSCHQSPEDAAPNDYRVSTPEARMPVGVAPLQRTPGGDFGWLKKHYIYTIDGATTHESGASHGHNIIAADFGFVADTANTTAPGGTFAAGELSCTSCHAAATKVASRSSRRAPRCRTTRADSPHRLRARPWCVSPARGSQVAAASRSGAMAVARVQQPLRVTKRTRVAMGATGAGQETWSRWCATCHPQMLSQGHSADVALGAMMRDTYAAYVKSGDLSGSLDTSYSSLVPFVENTSTFSALASHARSDNGALEGPGSSDLVSCITCHRAHASGWEDMMRWNNKSTFLTRDGAWPGTDTTPNDPQYARGRTSNETRAAYYDRPASRFATYQRPLCNKCHARD